MLTHVFQSWAGNTCITRSTLCIVSTGQTSLQFLCRNYYWPTIGTVIDKQYKLSKEDSTHPTCLKWLFLRNKVFYGGTLICWQTIQTVHRRLYTYDMSYVAVLAEKHSFLWRNCCLLQTIETFHRIFYTSDISDVAVLERNRNCVAFVDKQSRNFPQKILDQPIRRNIETSSLKDSVMSWLIRVLVDCDIFAMAA